MRNVLNEASVLDTVLSALRAIKNNVKANKGKGYLKGSISRYTKNLIMTFPVLCDNSISPETAMMISRANERNVADMLQLLFASMNIESEVGDGESGADILSRFYNGLDPNMDVNDLIDAIDDFVGNKDLPGIRYEEAQAMKEMVNQLRSLKFFPKENFNETSINDYIVKQGYNNRAIVTEVSTRSTRTSNQSYMKAASRKGNNGKNPDARDTIAAQRGIDQNYDSMDRQQKDNMNTVRNLLMANDVKKVNELQPLMLMINFNLINRDTKALEGKETFMAGIKSRLIPVSSSEIIDRFATKNRTKLSLKNLIRATTGEISFIKDFLFCLDQSKINSKVASKNGPLSNVWHILEKRAAKNNLNKTKHSGNDASAITTVALSQESVNYMKNAYMFDIEDPRNAVMIMDSFNLLSLFIVDDALEMVKCIYDGNVSFDTYSYASLDRDMSQREQKKLINLYNSVGR